MVALLLILPFNKIQAQSSILDWVGDQIKGYVNRKIDEMTGYNKSTLGSWGSAIWDGVVSAKTESDLKEKMSELNNFEPYRINWNSINSKYGINDEEIDYRKIYWNQSDFTKSILYSKHNIPLNSLGKGSIASTSDEIIDAKYDKNTVSSLKEILSPAVLDSVAYFSSTCKGLEGMLMMDININRDIATILNNHPKALRVYVNAFSVPEIRISSAQLLYWGYTADSHRNKLGKKSKYMPNPRTFTFNKDSRFVNVYNGKDIIAQILYIPEADKDIAIKFDCKDINILNFKNMPSATYSTPYMTFDTDRYGRITKFSQTGGNKSKQKTKFKAKDFLLAKGHSTANTPLLLGIQKLGIPETMTNTFFIENSNDNKKTLKQIKKTEKKFAKELSQHSPMNYILEYEDGGVVPSEIKVKYGNLTFALENVDSHKKIHQKQPSQSKQEETDFLKNLKQRVVKQQNSEYVPPVDNNSLNNTTKTTVNTTKKNDTSNAQTEKLSTLFEKSYKQKDTLWELLRNPILSKFLINNYGKKVYDKALKIVEVSGPIYFTNGIYSCEGAKKGMFGETEAKITYSSIDKVLDFVVIENYKEIK